MNHSALLAFINFFPRTGLRVNIFSGMGHTKSAIIARVTCSPVPTWSCSRLDQTVSESFPILTHGTQGGDLSEKKMPCHPASFPNLPPQLQWVLNWCGPGEVKYHVWSHKQRDTGAFEEHPWLLYKGALLSTIAWNSQVSWAWVRFLNQLLNELEWLAECKKE